MTHLRTLELGWDRVNLDRELVFCKHDSLWIRSRTCRHCVAHDSCACEYIKFVHHQPPHVLQCVKALDRYLCVLDHNCNWAFLLCAQAHGCACSLLGRSSLSVVRSITLPAFPTLQLMLKLSHICFLFFHDLQKYRKHKKEVKLLKIIKLRI